MYGSSQVITSTQKDVDSTYFNRVLEYAGVTLTLSEDPNILTKEQSLVIRDIEKNLISDSPNNKIHEFLKGLKSFCKKEEYFRKALLHTQFKQVSDPNETVSGSVHIQQEGLFRLLLNINCIQKEIIDLLLEEVTLKASEEEQDTSWLRLLLNTLRYLPYIIDPQNLKTKLLDALEIATYASQLEILNSIPDILPDNQQSETAKQLTRLLDENDELSGAIIDCLNSLNLETEIRIEVQDRILAKMIAGTSLKIYPVLLDFLMSDNKAPNLVQTLSRIRNSLDTVMTSSSKSSEKESSKIVIFYRLQAHARAPKTISDGWLNMIATIKTHSDHKPIDYLILFMLHLTVKSKRKIIEGIFRKRIATGLFKISILESMFEKYITQQLLKDYFSSMTEIGCSLLRGSHDPLAIEFATTLFRTLFNHQFTQLIYRRELLDNLILTSALGDLNNVSATLKILLLILQDNYKKVQQHTILLMKLLEKLDSFELKDVKQVFEILCSLTCGENVEDSMSGLKDEVHMIVRKQLSSTRRNYKHMGIVSAVVMAKHLAITTEDQSELDVTEDSIISIASLPQGPPREAACLLELTNTCTSGSPELTGLYYDQLVSMLLNTDNLDKHFQNWLYDTITNDFQNLFLADSIPQTTSDLELSIQYSLNTEEEMSTPLNVNIAGLTMNPEHRAKNSILILAPHFKIMRLLHYRNHNGDLSSIDALLGCGVILPETDDISSSENINQIQQVVDCLFHCINWFREVVSGFVTQKSKKLRVKVVHRLNHIIKLENMLYDFMNYIPDHKLPVSYFDSLSQVTKQQTSPVKVKHQNKKFKSAATVNTQADNTIASTAAATTTKVIPNKKSKSEFNIKFREMDTDIVILLKYPLKFDDDDDDEDQDMSGTATASLNIAQLNFLLKDYILKLDILTQGKNIGLSHLNIVSPTDLIKDSILILPNVNKHLMLLIKKIRKILDEVERRDDSPVLFTPEADDLKACFGLILQSFQLVFSWSGFQHSKNLDLLKSILKCLRSEQSQSVHSANRLIIDFIVKLSDYTDCCLHLSHAVSLIKTMEALRSTTVATPELQKKIVLVSMKLLGKRWYNSKGVVDCGKNCNANIDILVKTYLRSADVKTIYGHVVTLQEQVPMLKTKEDSLQMLNSIDKQNFYIFYQNLCSSLHNQVKCEIQSLTNNQHLILWKNTILTMQGLMAIAKVHETKVNLSCFLKQSIAILKIFLSHGIPILEIMLRSKTDEVVGIFKTMQNNTRFLHHLCCYSKLTKDTSLMAHVPQFRLTLESLVYRVKAALVANNCSAAFWMGNLKNKDIYGEDILSQSTVVTDTTINDEAEELPVDDDEISDNEAEARSRAESEVFD